MKPPPFRYVAPLELEHALELLLGGEGEAKVLAGGQSLMPMLNFRLLAPDVLVDINRLPGLSGVHATASALRIGALTRHRALETSPVIGARLPVVSEAMRHVAHLAIRNRGTLGGSLAHADPAGELPMLMCLLDATIHVRSGSGERAVPAADFFVAPLVTTLEAGEIVTAVELPALPDGTGWGFHEVARRTGDFALAAVGVTLGAHGGVITSVRVAVAGVDDTPRRLPTVEAVLCERPLEADALAAAGEAASDCVNPPEDPHASADYRRHLTAVLTRRAVTAAWGRARGGGGAVGGEGPSPGAAPR